MIKKLIAVLYILLLSLNTAYAVLVEGEVFLDSFADNTAGSHLPLFPGFVFTSETGSLSTTSSDFSTSRQINVTKTGALRSSSVQVVNNELQIVTDSAITSDNTFTYANSNFDLTLGRSYEPKFEGFILGLTDIGINGIDIVITVEGDTATQFVNNAGLVLFSKTDFVAQGVNFTNVNDIVIEIHNYAGVNATFDYFEYGFIPEPVTLALFGAGLFGIGFVRRRKFNL